MTTISDEALLGAVKVVEDEPARPDRRGGVWLAGVSGLSLVLNAWDLSQNGLGNTFYAAAARSMSENWHNFFFNSYDPGGFITVDKPPVAMWIQALSVRVFGFSSWSLLLPSAIAGAAAVALLWCIVRRFFGVAAATIAGVLLALSPINVAVNRLNMPDPFMILFLIVCVWAVMRSLNSARGVRWLVLAGIFAGLAFNTKMLAAYIPLPAIGLAVLIGTVGAWKKKIGHCVVFGVSSLAFSLPWMLIVDSWDKSARPFIGGSTNNTVWDLVFGYNGLGRVDGTGQGGGGITFGGLGGPGGVFGGTPGGLRLLNDAVGGQIAWLLPIALVCAVVAIWFHRRDGQRAAGVVLFAGWAVLHGIVFSYAKGTFHSYYTSALAPGLAAIIGIGGVALWRLVRENLAWLVAVAVALLGTVALQIDLADRTPDFYGWTKMALVVLVVAAFVGLVIAVFVCTVRQPVLMGSLGVGLIAVALTPSAWAASETTNATLNATLPQAGPRAGAAGGTFGSLDFTGNETSTLADFLRAANTGERWDLVVTSAMQASTLIAQDGVSVMALGGFIGTDPAATVASVGHRIDKGEVRYFLVSGGGFGGGGGFGPPSGFPNGTSGPNGAGAPGGAGGARDPGFQPPAGFPAPGTGAPSPNGGRAPNFPGGGSGPGGSSGIMNAVRSVCAPVTVASKTPVALPAQYDGQIYDCAGKGDPLRQSGG